MLVGSSPRRVAVIGGARIPFARSNTAYAETSNREMLTAALTALAVFLTLLSVTRSTAVSSTACHATGPGSSGCAR